MLQERVDLYKMKKGIKYAINESNRIEGVFAPQAHSSAYRAFLVIKPKVDYLTVDVVLDAHRIMMYNVNRRISGRLRNCDVWIGGVRKIFISECLLKEELSRLFGKIQHDIVEYHDSDEAHKEFLCKLRHVEFEEIHPFEDGNGRIGRMIYYAMRIKMGLPLNPIECKDKHEYYKWFMVVKS